MNCIEIRSLIAAQPFNEVWPESVKRQFAQHLEKCADCKFKFGAVAVLEQWLVSADSDSPLGERPGHNALWDRIKKRIDAPRNQQEERARETQVNLRHPEPGGMQTAGSQDKHCPPGGLRDQIETRNSLAWVAAQRRRWKSLRIPAGLAAAIAISLALYWMIQGNTMPTEPRLDLVALQEPKLSPIPFPLEQIAYARDSFVKLNPHVPDDTYRYVLFFDDQGTVEIIDEAAMAGQADWHWHLTGKQMDTAVLLATSKPLANIESLETRISGLVQGASLDPGARIVWVPRGLRVEVLKTMGEPPSSQTPPWATRVSHVLNSIPNATYQGWSLPVREERP